MFKKFAAAVTLFAASAGAFAAEPMPLYIGVDASSTKIEDIDREGGYGAFVGYKLNQEFSFEAGYHRLVDADYTIGTTNGNVTLDQFDISVIGTLPLSNGFNLYGRLGYTRLEAESNAGGFSWTERDSGAVVGLGLGYAFSPQVSGRLEVQRPGNDTTKLAAGIAFHF